MADRLPPFGNAGATQTQVDARQAWVNRQIGHEFLDLEKHVAWQGAYILDQVVLRNQGDGWLLILKAHRNGKAKVAFVEAPSMQECLELGGEFAARGVLTWQADSWPSKRLKKLLGLF